VRGATLDDLQVEAFAAMREAAWRVLGERPYDVQVFGAAALHDGNIAEMKTGEGKTLTSTMPVYLNALTGKGVHIVTVNEYLAKRDAEWMGQVHRFMGLDVGVVHSGQTRDDKRAAYAPTSPTAPTTSSASTTCATTWPGEGAPGAARPLHGAGRRSRLDPRRRGAHAADHLGTRGTDWPSCTRSSRVGSCQT
jgi:hypothetical protein